MRFQQPLLLAGLSLALGCSSAAPPEDDLWVTVGHGQTDYVPLANGDAVELVYGPQGGWHLNLGARVGGIGPDSVILTYRVWDAARTHQVGYPIKMVPTLRPSPDDDSFEQCGIRVVLAIGAPEDVVQRALLVETELIDGPLVVRDARSVLIVDREP
ncbi:MAG: hypothetical protein VB934_03440 [Polyangiaceae bacterium]